MPSLFITANMLSVSFTGLLHVRQVPILNCLASQFPDHKDLAFKLKRKQFSIEVYVFLFYSLLPPLRELS